MFMRRVFGVTMPGMLLPAAASAVPVYEIHDLGSDSFATWVNAFGQVVGSTVSGTFERAFIQLPADA